MSSDSDSSVSVYLPGKSAFAAALNDHGSDGSDSDDFATFQKTAFKNRGDEMALTVDDSSGSDSDDSIAVIPEKSRKSPKRKREGGDDFDDCDGENVVVDDNGSGNENCKRDSRDTSITKSPTLSAKKGRDTYSLSSDDSSDDDGKNVPKEKNNLLEMAREARKMLSEAQCIDLGVESEVILT